MKGQEAWETTQNSPYPGRIARGPEENRTPDLTRASGAEAIYGYSRAFTFSAIPAGQTPSAPHAYSHLLPPVSVGDVGDLLGTAQASRRASQYQSLALT